MNNFNQLNVNERNAYTHTQKIERECERYIRHDERVKIARDQSQLLARNWRRL